MDITQAALVGAVFLVAGCVKGVTGMGLPTVAVSLLGLWMAPAQAAALLVAPSLATNVAQCRGPHWPALAARLWPAWLALAVVTIVTPGVSASALVADTGLLLGATLVVYGMWGLWRPALPGLSARAPWSGVVAGSLTGLITALTSVFVMPMVPYLQALRLDKDALVQALGLSFTVATLALALRLQNGGGLSLWSTETALALGAAFVGLRIGAAARARFSARAFQRTLFVVFIALGAANVFRIH